MATTFSSNIGSSSKGAFSAYAVTTNNYVSAFFADMVTGNVINSTDGEEVYATTLTANQLAALSTNLKGLLAAGTASGADPTANPLAYLRKLVGFVALDDGQTLGYFTDSYTVDGVDYTEFYIQLDTIAPGAVLMYIPNSASAGLFTGSGSDNGAVPVPPPPSVPTKQAFDYFTYIPGLYTPGAVPMTASGLVNGYPTTISVNGSDTAGFAEVISTGNVSFIVEKFTVSSSPVPVGSGTQICTIDFSPGSALGFINNVDTDALVLDGASGGIRVINPAVGDATLSGVTIRIAATTPLIP